MIYVLLVDHLAVLSQTCYQNFLLKMKCRQDFFSLKNRKLLVSFWNLDWISCGCISGHGIYACGTTVHSIISAERYHFEQLFSEFTPKNTIEYTIDTMV